jgi:hypothetical protein
MASQFINYMVFVIRMASRSIEFSDTPYSFLVDINLLFTVTKVNHVQVNSKAIRRD